MAEKMVRMSFTLPPRVRDDLGYLSGRLGVTKSAFVSALLGEALVDLRRLVEDNIPEQPTDDDVKRFRGDSRALIEERVGSLQRMTNDLFSDL